MKRDLATSYPKLWISFHRQANSFDRWALYLDSENEADCDIWQASGRTLEFEPTHITGARPEKMPDFTEKWLLRDRLMPAQVAVLREVAGEQPVDNEAEFWDCRVYCFEILAQLEKENVLGDDSEEYSNLRERLHEKWMKGKIAPRETLEESDVETNRQRKLSRMKQADHSHTWDKSYNSNDRTPSQNDHVTEPTRSTV